MEVYRIFVLNRDDRIVRTEVAQFETDRAAVTQARRLLANGHAAEVWSDSRLVERIGEEFRVR